MVSISKCQAYKQNDLQGQSTNSHGWIRMRYAQSDLLPWIIEMLISIH